MEGGRGRLLQLCQDVHVRVPSTLLLLVVQQVIQRHREVRVGRHLDVQCERDAAGCQLC